MYLSTAVINYMYLSADTLCWEPENRLGWDPLRLLSAVLVLFDIDTKVYTCLDVATLGDGSLN